MAIRLYTTDAYEQIRTTIENIHQTDLSPVKDFFSDVWQRLAQFFGFLKVEDYEKKINTWYSTVLDSHNTTLAKVDKIFDAVDKVDSTYSNIVGDAYKSTVSFRHVVNNLRDVISGKVTIEAGKVNASNLIAEGVKSLQSSALVILTRMENRTTVAALKGLVGDILGTCASVCKFIGACVSGNGKLVLVSAKKIVDSFVGTLGDLGSLMETAIAVPIVGLISEKIGMSTGRYINWRFEMLTESEGLRTTDSLSDVLNMISDEMQETLEECPESSGLYPIVSGATKVTKAVAVTGEVADIAADAYDVYDSVSDGIKNVNELFKGKETSISFQDYYKKYKEHKTGEIIGTKWSNGKLILVTKIQPTEVISELFSGRTGIPTTGWGDPAKTTGNILKTAKTAWSYGQKYISNGNGLPASGEWSDVAFKNFKEIKLISDIKDVAHDVIDKVGDIVTSVK